MQILWGVDRGSAKEISHLSVGTLRPLGPGLLLGARLIDLLRHLGPKGIQNRFENRRLEALKIDATMGDL